LIDEEAEVCFKEEKNWLEGPGVLGQMESAYNVGLGCSGWVDHNFIMILATFL